MNGVAVKNLNITFALAVKVFNSILNFLLLNTDFSIVENTLTISPPVLFKIDSDAEIYLASSVFILLANLSNATSNDKPRYV